MINAIFRPVDHWPGEPTSSYKRQKPRFGATYAKTLDDLERELNAIKATDIVIQVYMERSDIRNDGWPRSGASPKSPGVIVTFQQGKDAISMPCDTYLHWHQNLRAITMTLHALRMVAQYGVTKHNEQYAGFKQIAAPESDQAMTADEAGRFLEQYAGCKMDPPLINNPSMLDSVYRAAAKRLHPDSPTGSHALFVRLQAANDILQSHFGWK